MMEWIIALAVLSAAVFAVPLRAKWWTALAVVCAGAAIASAEALSVLASGACAQYPAASNVVFGSGFGTADPLSAVFLLIVLRKRRIARGRSGWPYRVVCPSSVEMAPSL